MSRYHLPADVLFNVLARLPVKSLVRFRCVSKSWTAIIDSPEFIKIQLNMSLTDSKSQKIILETTHLNYRSRSLKLLAGNFNSRENLISSSVEELYYPQPDHQQGKKLVGSCNGLLCIRYTKYGVVLCNPWIRKHKKLPTSPVEIKFSGGRKWIYTIYGFGYEDVSDDYKVVRLVGVRNKATRSFCNEVKVYSLKSNSWRRIEDLSFAIPSRFHLLPGYARASGVLLNCALHWILTTPESILGIPESILAINLRTEQSQFLPLPDDGFATGSGFLGSKFGVLNGCLCHWEFVRVPSAVEIWLWLMKDYGIKDSWTKIKVQISTAQVSNQCLSTMSAIGYSDSGSEKQMIFYDQSARKVFRYDIEKELLSQAKVDVLGRVENICYSMPSLVQPYTAIGRGARSKRRKISSN